MSGHHLGPDRPRVGDRKSTRLNSSHSQISYAVFCLKKKPGLAGLLASCVRRPGRSRILVTSRYPFTLPDDAQRELVFHHVGPMTFAETLKLVWSLPMLDRLDDADLERVWRMVGGHPRTLEYLDALLAAGTGRFPDVTRRLATAVRAKLGDEAGDRWLSASKNLDTALAESVTLAADDGLLDEHPTP